MASVDQLDSAPATPIAQLSPSLPDAATRAVRGVVTIVWPYNSVTNSLAFILAEPEFRKRRANGQVHVHLTGPSARAVADCALGSSDQVVLGLQGATWEADATGRHDWTLNYAGRLVLRAKGAEADNTRSVDVDQPAPPAPPQEQQQQPEAEHLVDTFRPATPDIADVPTPPPAAEKAPAAGLDEYEYASPAFMKRARVSYGALFDGGLDMFDDDGGAKGKGRKRARFGRHSGAWRYVSQSPSPEPETGSQDKLHDGSEEEQVGEGEPAQVESQSQGLAQSPERVRPQSQQQQWPRSSPRPEMMDEGCQTMEFDLPSSGPLPNAFGQHQPEPASQALNPFANSVSSQGHENYPTDNWASSMPMPMPPYGSYPTMPGMDAFGSNVQLGLGAGHYPEEWNPAPANNSMTAYPDLPGDQNGFQQNHLNAAGPSPPQPIAPFHQEPVSMIPDAFGHADADTETQGPSSAGAAWTTVNNGYRASSRPLADDRMDTRMDNEGRGPESAMVIGSDSEDEPDEPEAASRGSLTNGLTHDGAQYDEVGGVNGHAAGAAASQYPDDGGEDGYEDEEQAGEYDTRENSDANVADDDDDDDDDDDESQDEEEGLQPHPLAGEGAAPYENGNDPAWFEEDEDGYADEAEEEYDEEDDYSEEEEEEDDPEEASGVMAPRAAAGPLVPLPPAATVVRSSERVVIDLLSSSEDEDEGGNEEEEQEEQEEEEQEEEEQEEEEQEEEEQGQYPQQPASSSTGISSTQPAIALAPEPTAAAVAVGPPDRDTSPARDDVEDEQYEDGQDAEGGVVVPSSQVAAEDQYDDDENEDGVVRFGPIQQQQINQDQYEGDEDEDYAAEEEYEDQEAAADEDGSEEEGAGSVYQPPSTNADNFAEEEDFDAADDGKQADVDDEELLDLATNRSRSSKAPTPSPPPRGVADDDDAGQEDEVMADAAAPEERHQPGGSSPRGVELGGDGDGAGDDGEGEAPGEEPEPEMSGRGIVTEETDVVEATQVTQKSAELAVPLDRGSESAAGEDAVVQEKLGVEEVQEKLGVEEVQEKLGVEEVQEKLEVEEVRKEEVKEEIPAPSSPPRLSRPHSPGLVAPTGQDTQAIVKTEVTETSTSYAEHSPRAGAGQDTVMENTEVEMEVTEVAEFKEVSLAPTDRFPTPTDTRGETAVVQEVVQEATTFSSGKVDVDDDEPSPAPAAAMVDDPQAPQVDQQFEAEDVKMKESEDVEMGEAGGDTDSEQSFQDAASVASLQGDDDAEDYDAENDDADNDDAEGDDALQAALRQAHSSQSPFVDALLEQGVSNVEYDEGDDELGEEEVGEDDEGDEEEEEGGEGSEYDHEEGEEEEEEVPNKGEAGAGEEVGVTRDPSPTPKGKPKKEALIVDLSSSGDVVGTTTATTATSQDPQLDSTAPSQDKQLESTATSQRQLDSTADSTADGEQQEPNQKTEADAPKVLESATPPKVEPIVVEIPATTPKDAVGVDEGTTADDEVAQAPKEEGVEVPQDQEVELPHEADVPKKTVEASPDAPEPTPNQHYTRSMCKSATPEAPAAADESNQHYTRSRCHSSSPVTPHSNTNKNNDDSAPPHVMEGGIALDAARAELLAACEAKLRRQLKESLPAYTPLGTLRHHLDRSVDVMGVALSTPPEPRRARGGPREYGLVFALTDGHAVGGGSSQRHVVEVQIHRAHKDTLPRVAAGQVVVLHDFRIFSVPLADKTKGGQGSGGGGGFGLKAKDDASSWAVFDKGAGEPAQVRGRPLEYAEDEVGYAETLAEWWGLVGLDEEARAGLERESERVVGQGGK